MPSTTAPKSYAVTQTATPAYAPTSKRPAGTAPSQSGLIKWSSDIGLCGQAPSGYPDFAQFLVEQGIDSISLNPDTVMKTTVAILEKEKEPIQ